MKGINPKNQKNPSLDSSLGRGLVGLLLSAMGAAAFTLAFPPYNLWPLALIWMVPVQLALHRIMPKSWSGLALGVGVGGFFWGYFGGMFAGIPFMHYLPIGIGAIATLMGYRERIFHLRTGYRWYVVQGVIIWVGIEMIRGFIPVIGTWGFAAYTLYALPWLIQPVSVFSIYGLSALLMLSNFVLARCALDVWDHWGAVRGTSSFRLSANRSGGCLLLLVLVIGWTGLSLLMYQTPKPTLTVAAIQPGQPLRETSSSPFDEASWVPMLEQTRKAAQRGARFISWPEAYLPFDPQTTGTAQLRQLTREEDIYLAIGYAVSTPQGLRNEATVLAPNGEFLGIFGKDHPVVFAGETSLTRGTYPVYDTSIGRLGTIICYDLDFTDTTRKIARNGAQIIAVPSWDWPEIAHKHYSHVVFRAIENRVAMIKADMAHDSVIVDPFGNIIERHVTTHPTARVLTADVAHGTPNTLTMRWGDWVGWLCLVGMAVLLLADINLEVKVRKRRAGGSNSRFKHDDQHRDLSINHVQPLPPSHPRGKDEV